MDIKNILQRSSDSILAENIVSSYMEIEKDFIKKNWKVSELDAGHFVEATRRFIELQLFGHYTPIGTSLPNFNDVVLKLYEKASGNESYRILIPRTLYSIYTIRNKRGVGHLGLVKPNLIDATLIFQAVKWILAELVRLNSEVDIIETNKLITQITQRQLDILWKYDGVTRILKKNLRVDKKILILLYDSSPQNKNILQSNIKYVNTHNFNKELKKLDAKILIEFKDGKTCYITSLGENEAENILISIQK